MSNSTDKKKCFHCGLATVDTVCAQVDNKSEHFCCLGCASVSKVIFDANLENFYQFQSNAKPVAGQLQYPLEVYDLPQFQEHYLRPSAQKKHKEIELVSSDIHCAACVWLIEKSLGTMAGVKLVRVNLTGRRILLRWSDEVKLSILIKRLLDLGYVSAPYEEDNAKAQRQQHHKNLLYRISFASFAMMNLLWVSIALYSGAETGQFAWFFHWIGFALATPTLFYAGQPFLKNAYTGLKNAQMNMDLPISIGALVTYGYSSFVLFLGDTSQGTYFDTVVNFIFVILLGRYLESLARQSAIGNYHHLSQQQPALSGVLVGDNLQYQATHSIQTGAKILIKTGDSVPLDATLLSQNARLDESILTGESLPVSKTIGEVVFAGSINLGDNIHASVTKVAKHSTLAQIVDLAQTTQSNRGKIQCQVDVFIPYFVWTTLGLSLLTFLLWSGSGIEIALLAATSVLIITCPCAFGIATPMSLAVASNLAVKKNILLKNNDLLSILPKAKHLVFDKTGTLTTGKFSIDEFVNYHDKWSDEDLKNILYAIESQSNHPIATALTQILNSSNNLVASQVSTHTGLGIEATVDGVNYQVGGLGMMQKNKVKLSPTQLAKTSQDRCIFLSTQQNIIAMLVLTDTLKPEVKIHIKQLKDLGKVIHLLTGDNQFAAQKVGQTLGINHIISNVLPEQKAEYIKQLQQTGTTIMIGDGVNDAIALAQAQGSISFASGADIATTAADAILLTPRLSGVVDLIKLSQKTQTTISQNIGIALVYNILMVPLAMMAMITPLVAAIAMPLSSLAVIGNAARMRRWK